jgi:DNA adenine methylase
MPRAAVKGDAAAAPAAAEDEDVRLGPFLKWAGGKRSLLPQIEPLVPRRIDTYYEPFVGGGALFFFLAGEEPRRFRRAVLGDGNAELIVCYQAVKDDVEEVIRALVGHTYDQDHFYRVRALEPQDLSVAERAARTIYLNRTGFNGLYRVNSSGKFNVPFGRYKKLLQVCRPEQLRRVSQALRGDDVEIVPGDFGAVVAGARRGDFVYFDPPYVPVSATSKFTAYAQLGFGLPDQERLAETLRRLGRREVPALLSNSDCAFTRKLYRGLDPIPVDVRRSINSVASRRGPVSELLVKSFGYSVLDAADGEPGRSAEAARGAPGRRRGRAGGAGQGV